MPLVEMLGRAHDALPTSITIGIKPLAETLAEAAEYVERGFRILKVKIGLDLEQDLERLARLRESVGPGSRSAPTAIRVTRSRRLFASSAQTVPLELEFLEQPLPAAEVEAMRALPEEIRERIAADESLLTEEDARSARRPAPRLRDLQHQADEVRRHRARPAHRRGRGIRRDPPDVGVHGREPHLDRRRPPRGLLLVPPRATSTSTARSTSPATSFREGSSSRTE